MSLPQRHEIRDRVSEDSENPCHCSTNVELAPKSNRSEISHEAPLSTSSTFREDFTGEHSDFGIRIEVIELAGIF